MLPASGPSRSVRSAFERARSEEEIVERGEHRAALEALRDAMGALRPHEREVMDVVYQRGMTMDEDGRELGIHASTAQRRHVSGLRRLRARMEERGVLRAPPVRDEEAPP
jgi:RNA polymerase sigma factor (sigma-70 family)